ncbi:MAG: tRNA (guanine(10)-N(2))-dimethyltransferase [Candidatus Thermoplasmatota archaeon]
MSVSLHRISEGTTEVFIYPSKGTGKGPGVKENQPFYNPTMERSRDLSVVFLQWFLTQQKKHVTVLDGLAASGIRGVRFAHELTGDFSVVINDHDIQAYTLIQKNIEHNKLNNAVAYNQNLRELLMKNRFQYIDIDPFGSPIYYFADAVQSCTHNGVIACTATDTAPLCGVYPKVCLRRYAAHPYHSVVMHEIGLRILLGALGRDAARYDCGIEPLLSYAADHYFRAYVQIKRGKQYADATIEQIQPVSARLIPMSKLKNDGSVGPLWMGGLEHKKIISHLRTGVFERNVRTKHELWKLLSVLEEEAEMPPFFYTSSDLASSLKVSAPSMKTIVNYLYHRGFLVSRTHFHEVGFKTNAPYPVVKEVFIQQKR